jgi:hypothetical protein
MSRWADDPEYFEEWIEHRAMDGEFGEEIAAKVENGDLLGYELWDGLLDGTITGKLKDHEYVRLADISCIERLTDMAEMRDRTRG